MEFNKQYKMIEAPCDQKQVAPSFLFWAAWIEFGQLYFFFYILLTYKVVKWAVCELLDALMIEDIPAYQQ